MRFVFQSLAPQPGLTDETLVTAAGELRDFLRDDPVLKRAEVAAVTQRGALGLRATVYAKPEQLAKVLVMLAADEAWGRALEECGCEADGRSGALGVA